MKILLTGSNGMVGSWLAEKLSGSSHQTLATGRSDCRLDPTLFHSNFKYQQLDITNSDEVDNQIQQFQPNLIIHGAAVTQVDDCEQNKSLTYSINVAGTAHLLSSAEEVNARFLYLSTDFVFSGNSGPYSEADTTEPVNYYGQTKELAEQLVIESRLSTCIIRTILLFGKSTNITRSNFIYWVKDNLETGKPIRVVNDQIRTPTYIPDLVKGIMLAVEKGAVGTYHISGKEVFTPYDMAMEVADHLNLDKKLITPVDASTFTQIGKRPQKTGFHIEKAEKELGFCPTDFKTALTQIFG